MSDYTAYHLYGDRQYQEAKKADREPYTLPGYDCPHSQRAFLPTYDSYAQRIHDDAAGIGGCCNQPVELLKNRPQYQEIGDPTPSKKCTKTVEQIQCTDLEVGQLTWETTCADGAGTLPNIPFYCHDACPDDLLHLPFEQKIIGQSGAWIFKGYESEIEIEADYEIDQDTMDSVYNNCSGPHTIIEQYCGNRTLKLIVHGDLGATNGCQCDCCGNNGSFPAPVPIISASSLIPTWKNTLDIPGVVIVDEACYNGTLSGTWNGTLGGQQSVPWSYGPVYEGSGSSLRRMVGYPGTIGGSAKNLSACCGGSVQYQGSDGCGGNDSDTKSLAPRWASPYLEALVNGLPVTDLSPGDHVVFQLLGACAYTDAATLGLSPSCLSSNFTPGYYDGYIATDGEDVNLTSTFACAGCCGQGQVDFAWNNGCDETDSKTYHVRNPDSSGSVQRGALIACGDRGAGLWEPYWKAVSCDGTEGSGYWMGGAVSGVDNCVALIDSSSDSAIINLCALQLACPDGANCCHYTNNNLTGADFRAHIFCVNNYNWQSDPICCKELYTQNAGWTKKTSSTCCPA